MRWRDVLIIFSVLLSLLLTILTLIPGTKQHILRNTAIASFAYYNNDTVLSPLDPLPPCLSTPGSLGCGISNSTLDFNEKWGIGVYQWVFTVHYLALCSGAWGGTWLQDFPQWECERKPIGWTFRTDDPFIMNFAVINGSKLVEPRKDLLQISTMAPGATLVVGLVVSALALLVVLLDVFGVGSGSIDLPTGAAAMLGAASLFLMLSSALLTNAYCTGHWFDDGTASRYIKWTDSLLGLSWSAMSFMYVAFVGKVVDNVWSREKRRRVLTRDQI